MTISYHRYQLLIIKNTLRLLLLFLISTIWISCTKEPTDPKVVGPSTLKERMIQDTSYGTDIKQKMDIYLPAGRTSATKVVVFIHGGAWESGSKSDPGHLQISNLIKLKWPEAAVVTINYRLTSDPNIHYTEIMDDITSSVNFMINNKDNFGISDTLCMMGASAGAHLAMLYTYKYNTNNYVKCVADFFGPAQLSDWEWYNSYNIWLGRPIKEFLIQFNGSAWNESLYNSNSPLKVATTQSKPTIIFHGTIDVIVPIYQSQWLRAQLVKLGVANEYHEYLDSHGFNYNNTADAVDKSVVFFKKHLK